jgi:hypothetical protein
MCSTWIYFILVFIKAGLHDKRIGHGTPENGHRAKTPTSLFTRLHDNFL